MKYFKTILIVCACIFVLETQAQSVVFNNVYNDYSYFKQATTGEILYNNEYVGIISENENGIYTIYGAGENQHFFSWEDSLYVYNYIVDIDEFGDTLSTTRINLTTTDDKESTISGLKIGNYEYIIGMTNNVNLPYFENINAKIIKLDINRDTLWNRVYNMGDDNKFVTIKTNDNGENFQVLGFADIDTSGINYDAFISTIDSNGNLLSNIQLGGTENDFLYGLEYLDNGNYLVCGHTFSFGVVGSDIWLMEVDINGNIIWQKTYGDIYYERIQNSKCMIIKNDFIYIAGGGVDTLNSVLLATGWLLKLDMQGNVIWDKKYNRGSNTEYFIGIQEYDNTSFILGGQSFTYNSANEYPAGWLLKLDTLGNIVWEREIVKYKDQTTLVHHYPADMLVTQDKGILLGGYVIANAVVDINGYFHRNDAWLAKTDSCGFTVGDLPQPMLLIDSIVGKTVHITDQSQNYCTAALDWGDGTELQNYYAYENNQPLAAKHFSHTYSQTGDITIRTTALAGEEFREYEVQVLGLNLESVIAMRHEEAISLFPNPANDYIIIENKQNIASSFKMNIYSLNGKLINTKQLNPKLYQQKLDVSSLNNGVYFVRFELDDMLLGTEKLVIAR